MDRLPSLTEEILKIGQDSGPTPLVSGASSEGTSQNVLTSFAPNGTLPSDSEKTKRDMEIEEYPRALAVVGVSVL